MKRIITILFAFMLSFVALYAQKDVTRFLGIPVDGSQTDMINKLKEKGFKHLGSVVLEGEFNGNFVRIYIVTNKNKVWRIIIANQNTRDEAEIKRQFNELFDQFSNNDKYMHDTGKKISDSENLYKKIAIEKKDYSARFYQKSQSDKNDDNISKRLVWFNIVREYGEYRIGIYYDNIYNKANGEDL